MWSSLPDGHVHVVIVWTLFPFSLQKHVTLFLDAILQSQEEISDVPNQQSLPGLCRNSVLITENELHSLVNIHRENPFTWDPVGGGGTPYNGLYGEAPLETGTFFRLQVYKRVGVPQVEGRLGKSVIYIFNRAFNYSISNRRPLWLYQFIY